MRRKGTLLLAVLGVLLLVPSAAYCQDNGGGGDEVTVVRLKATLSPQEEGSEARGVAYACQRGEDIRLVVAVGRLEPGKTYQVTVTGAGADVPVIEDTLTTREGRRWRPGGHGILYLSTRRGDELPELEGLVGSEVKVAGPVPEEEPPPEEAKQEVTLPVVLQGVLEEVEPPEPVIVQKSVTRLGPPEGDDSRARGILMITSRGEGETLREVLALVAMRLTPGTEYSVTATDSEGNDTTIGDFTTTERVFFCPGGLGFLKVRELEGLESLLELVGQTVNVTDPEGNLALTGVVAEAEQIERRRHFGWPRCPLWGRRHRQGGEEPPEEGGGEEPAKALSLPTSVDFPTTDPHDATFMRGDVNEDGVFNIADPIALLTYLFAGRSAPYCLDAADANDDGRVDVADSTRMLMSLFQGGPAKLPPPFVVRGTDPTPDSMYCRSQ